MPERSPSSIERRPPKAPVDATKGDETLTERAAELIENAVLAGKLAPGKRLAVQALSREFGVGLTPLREGISRLTARGLVKAVGQRGFWVTDISERDLEDITRVRRLIELDAVERSIVDGDEAWEVGIVSALYRLRRWLERRPEDMAEDAMEFDALHRSFHHALVAACGSPRLLALQDQLYQQAYRYRRIMMRRLPDPAWFITVHQELADTILSREIPTARRKLDEHLGLTLATVYGDGQNNNFDV